MADSPTLQLTVDGKPYTLRLGDFNALDAREYRRELGAGLLAAFSAPDLDTICGLLWLHRRKTEPKLKYEDVARTFTYESVDIVSEGEPAEDDDPET